VLQGEKNGAFDAANRRHALLDALLTGLQKLGVQVEGSITSIQRVEATETNGDEKVQVYERSEQIAKATVASVEMRNFRSDYCHENGQVKARVVFPQSEWARITRMKRGGTVVALQCTSEPTGACGPAIDNAVRAAAQTAGLRVVGVVTTSPNAGNAPTAVIQLGAQHKAARVLWIQIAGRILAQQGGILWAVTDASTNLYETSDGQGLRSWTPPPGDRPFKIGLPARVSTAVNTVRESMKQAILGTDDEDGIQQAISTWKD